MSCGGANGLVGSVTVQHSQGSLERTGQPLDGAIEGPGMFLLSDGSGTFYSRDGSFALDNNNALVHAGTGYLVQGWMAAGGEVTATGPPQDLSFDISQLTPPVPTANTAVIGNLNANSAENAEVYTNVSVYDSLSELHQLTISFTKTANVGEWDVEVSCGADTATTTITFDAEGALNGDESVTLDLNLTNGAVTPQSIAVALEQMTSLTHPFSVAVQSQDGRPASSLISVEMTDQGNVEGQYSDGRSETLAQVALASFTNPGGLRRLGSNLFAQAPAAGMAAVGGANTGGRGRVVGQALEMSNVDLTKAFVDMIITQKGFQASTRVISTANEMLDEVVRLVRS